MKVIAFGEIMMRMMVPNHKLLTQTNQLETLYCGTGLNILAQLSKWGYHCEIVSSLPKNAIGEAAAAKVRQLNVGDKWIHYHHDTIGSYFLEVGYGPRPSVVTYMGRSNSAFSLSSIDDYLIEDILVDVDAIHICGIALALSENVKEVAIALAKKAYEMGIYVCFDFNYRPSLWKDKTYDYAKSQYERILPYCHLVFGGAKDAEYILGIKDDSFENQMKTVLERYNIDMIAGTKREHHVNETLYQGFIVDKTSYNESDKYPLSILDRIGAGDGYAAGIISGILENKDKKTMVDFATCCAVLAHTTYGDSPILSKEMIENYLNHTSVDILR